MQTDQIIDTWVQEIETAFQPYAKFVEAVARQLESIELQAILAPSQEVQVVVRTEVINTPAPVQAAAQTPAEKPKKKLSEKRVLLIDDAEINRVLMSHYFKGLPVKLEFAPNAEAALRKCEDSVYDLIVVDDELQSPNHPNFAQSLKSIGKGAVLISLSNRDGQDTSSLPEYFSVLKRGLPRELFVERLKNYLWSA